MITFLFRSQLIRISIRQFYNLMTSSDHITVQGESVGASLDVSQSVHDDGEKTDWQLVTNK